MEFVRTNRRRLPSIVARKGDRPDLRAQLICYRAIAGEAHCGGLNQQRLGEPIYGDLRIQKLVLAGPIACVIPSPTAPSSLRRVLQQWNRLQPERPRVRHAERRRRKLQIEIVIRGRECRFHHSPIVLANLHRHRFQLRRSVFNRHRERGRLQRRRIRQCERGLPHFNAPVQPIAVRISKVSGNRPLGRKRIRQRRAHVPRDLNQRRDGNTVQLAQRLPLGRGQIICRLEFQRDGRMRIVGNGLEIELLAAQIQVAVISLLPAAALLRK